MNVTLLAYTHEPEKVVAAAAKICYSDSSADELLDGLDITMAKNFITKLNDNGHMSPLEHVSFTFGIDGVSRTLLAQITRHRIASYSVQSQRYVKQKNFTYITPKEIEDNEEALEIYNKSMEASLDAYNKITDLLIPKYKKENIENGMSEKMADNAAEKKAIEDARFVLPNACETKMVMTMNARSLINFFGLRCCNRAQWEIRELAKEMYKLVYVKAPSIFKNAGPHCCSGKCPEGKMTCGKMEKVREEYTKIRESYKAKLSIDLSPVGALGEFISCACESNCMSINDNLGKNTIR